MARCDTFTDPTVRQLAALPAEQVELPPPRAQPGYYPDFSTLSQQRFWDDATRARELGNCAPAIWSWSTAIPTSTATGRTSPAPSAWASRTRASGPCMPRCSRRGQRPWRPSAPARAADVDRAARDVLAGHGFGEQFTHGLGHNVGFSAISAEFPPRLHPVLDDRLEIGMTFNVEPVTYIEGYGGVRHCDVIALGEGGAEVLTPFQASPGHLIIDA